MENAHMVVKLLLIFNFVNFITPNTHGFVLEYILNNNKCKIPDYQAFNNETIKYFEKRPYVNCSKRQLLTFIERQNNVATLKIRDEAISSYVNAKENLRCCYLYVRRSGTLLEPDRGISYSQRVYFNTSFTLTEEIVKIECYDSSTYDLVYENAHHVVLNNKQTKLMKEQKSKNALNVLFIVIDSVSRQNLIRTMPNTYNLLKQLGFNEFKGYNKINLNTFPNFMALLSGLNLEQSNELCNPTIIGSLDNCPMIWKDFEKMGYITAYAEDWSTINTFNYQKKGFQNPPTTYYYKPYFEASEELGQLRIDTMPFCAGPESAGERMYNLAIDFAKSFQNLVPTFGIFWLNTFSHNDVSSTTRMDEKTYNFFQTITNEGVLNDTIVFFISDHGVRFGNVCRTTAGYFEERQPFNLISLPYSFKQNFPNEFQNFIRNKDKLVSTYDIFMTLQHLLTLYGYNHTVRNSLACSTCKSIFLQMPEQRSCAHAGIGDIWCSCVGDLTDISVKSAIVINNEEEVFQLIGPKTSVIRARLSESVMNEKYLLLDVINWENLQLLLTFKIFGNNEKGKLLQIFEYNR